MKYQGVNRVFRIDEKDESFFYIAPTQVAAVACHATRDEKPKRSRTMKANEVPPEQSIGVMFDDCAEAIARITGANPDIIRPTLSGMPLADEPITIRRAADQWARMARDGEASLLRVL